MSLFDEILSVDHLDFDTVDYKGKPIHIRGMTTGEYERLQKVIDGESRWKAMRYIVAFGLCDSEGKRIVKPEDERVAELSAKFVNFMMPHIQRVSGISGKDVDELVGESETMHS